MPPTSARRLQPLQHPSPPSRLRPGLQAGRRGGPDLTGSWHRRRGSHSLRNRHDGRLPRLALVAVVLTASLAASCRREEPTLGGRSLTAWVSSLASERPPERRQACETLGRLGPAAASAVPALIERLADRQPDVARAAAAALVAVGPDAIAPLERALDVHAPPPARLFASYALVQLVPGHDGALSVLFEAFTATSDPPRAAEARTIVVALGRELAPRVAALLDDPYAPLRAHALDTLGAMRERARGQLDRVLAALESPEPSVRLAAARAAARIGPSERVLGPLRQASADRAPEVATAAAALAAALANP